MPVVLKPGPHTPLSILFSNKSLQSRLGRVLQVIVTLKGEPLSRSQVTCTPEQVFTKDFSVFDFIHPLLSVTSASPQHDAATMLDLMASYEEQRPVCLEFQIRTSLLSRSHSLKIVIKACF